MPARIVVVHDEPEVVDEIGTALSLAGYDVAHFTDPMNALDVFSTGQPVDLLITRINFGIGKPHGLSLALMARTRHRDIRILFTALPEFREHAKGLGEFMPLPVSGPEVLAIVERLLKPTASEPQTSFPVSLGIPGTA